jgi:hypothetical protein
VERIKCNEFKEDGIFDVGTRFVSLCQAAAACGRAQVSRRSCKIHTVRGFAAQNNNARV